MKIAGKIRQVQPLEIGGNSIPVIFTHVGVANNTSSGALLDAEIEVEIEKIQCAISKGAQVICDVSMNNHIEHIQEKMLNNLTVPFGSVCIYETYIHAIENDLHIEGNTFLDMIYRQILRGVDVITLHATVLNGDRCLFETSGRIIPATSRGGMLMLELLEKNGYENPYYTHFNEIVALCKQYGVGISLGPAYRPGSVADCRENGDLHLIELKRMSQLVQMALDADVTIMLEGIGHAPINKIPEMVRIAKNICPGAAYRVMTVSTDIAIGYDHISSSIASAVAVQYGADSITCVTRSEHIGVPCAEEVEESVIAARIAAHSGYIARSGDFSRDMKMSRSRKKLGCLGQIEFALFPEAIKKATISPMNGIGCSMCGDYCPLSKQNSEEQQDGIC